MDEVKLRNGFVPAGLEKRCRWKGSGGEENKSDEGEILQKSISLPPEWNGAGSYLRLKSAVTRDAGDHCRCFLLERAAAGVLENSLVGVNRDPVHLP